MNEVPGFLIGVFLFFLYFFGMYEIVTDDHRYTTKDVVIGAMVFPYPWWVGGKELYRIMATSSEDREMELQCLDKSEILGVPRKARLTFCECLIETKNLKICQSKVFGGS